MSHKSKYSSLRWILLAAGIVAIIGLTAMNVYSLYALRNNTIESVKETKKLQVAEFADEARKRFKKPFWGLGSLDMQHVDQTVSSTGQFPDKAVKVLRKAAKDSIYNDIFFIPAHSDACKKDVGSISKFDEKSERFIKTADYSDVVCDGVGIAKTRMKVLINGYNFNNKVIYDTHRSMTIALVNLDKHKVFGYLTMPVNQSYLSDGYLKPMLQQKFGNPKESGIIVWVRDWTKNRIIAKSDPDAQYHPKKVNFYKKFTDFFDDWQLEVAFTQNPEIAASKASLVKNMIVLVAAFILLLGALVFMFITAQRERALAERQAGFLANVTHELKTPLAVMQAAGENLADGRVEDRSRLKSYGTHIYNEALRLKKMIDKLLDVAKADAGDELIEPQTVYLNKLMYQYLEEHREYIQDKGFTLETSIDSNLPPVKIDVENFEAIVSNLVENAIKYSDDEKYIYIALYEQDGRAVLRVEDHGTGIDKKSMKHIFEKFYRSEDALTAKTKGHGLGLSIVKNLVELNGGNIEVKSEEQEGTTFIIRFPVISEMQEEEETEPSTLTSRAPQPLPLTKE